MIGSRAVSFDLAQQFADSLGIDFIETSAKSAVNIEKAFLTITQKLKTRVPQKKLNHLEKKGITISGQPLKIVSSSMCC